MGDRRRIALAAAVAAVLVTVGTATALLARDSPGGAEGPPPAAPSGERPARIAAMDDDGRLVLLSAADGRELRVLAEVYGPRAHVDATPDGRTLYFSPSVDQDPGAGCESPVVESISVDGGDRKRIDRGSAPIVSPDGRRLAYLQFDASSCEHSSIVMRELYGDGVRSWPLGEGVGVTLMSWSPDSRHLTVVSDDDEGADDLVNQELDTESGGALADADRITTEHPDREVLGELGTTGALAALTGRTGLAAIDRETGEVLRTLYEFTDPEAPRPFYDDRRFDSDPSGRHLLWIGSWGRSDVLSRYTVGDPAPTELGEGFGSATWVPGSERD